MTVRGCDMTVRTIGRFPGRCSCYSIRAALASQTPRDRDARSRCWFIRHGVDGRYQSSDEGTDSALLSRSNTVHRPPRVARRARCLYAHQSKGAPAPQALRYRDHSITGFTTSRNTSRAAMGLSQDSHRARRVDWHRKTDYAGYLIAANAWAHDLHFTLSYAAVGQANGEGNANSWVCGGRGILRQRAAAAQAEYVGSPAPAARSATAPLRPRVRTARSRPKLRRRTFWHDRLRYRYADNWDFAFGVSYDNNNAWLYAPESLPLSLSLITLLEVDHRSSLSPARSGVSAPSGSACAAWPGPKRDTCGVMRCSSPSRALFFRQRLGVGDVEACPAMVPVLQPHEIVLTTCRRGPH